MDRARAEARMARTGSEPPVPFLQRDEELSRLGDGVDPELRPRAMGGAAADDDFAPSKTFMRDGRLQVTRLADDRRVGAELRDDLFRAEGCMFLIGHAGDDEIAGELRCLRSRRR